jgi:DNA polymerase III alpha subunit (gram-positive type)
VSFDFGFLAYEAERFGYEGPRVWYIDTLTLARRLLPTVQDYQLGTVLTHFDLLPEAPLHTALTDAWATRRLFWKLVEVG